LNSIEKISAVIIVKDAEQTIAQTLESLKNFDEVILYDNGSIDKTTEIASKYENVKIIIGEFKGFGDTKNCAANYAKNDWIFSIDSDEVLSIRLHDSINDLQLDDNCVYWCYRYNYYRKKRVKYSGWGKEKVTRLYNKKVTQFNNRLVHEGIVVSRNLTVAKVSGEIRHYSYMSIADFIKKRSFYSDLFAIENQGSRKSSPLKAIISGAFVFFNTFLVRLAFLDGYRGLLIAVTDAHETFLKHIKLYEANLENNFKVSLIVTSSANADILVLSLNSILEQSIIPNEIIIIETNKSSELKLKIEKFVKKSFIKVFVIGTNGEINVAQLRNKAIAKSSYDYLIFVDGSSVLHPHFIKDHIAFAKKGLYLQGDIIRLTKEISDKVLKKKKI
jgi:glycosyltransferase involved in cell wall biosynthesis